METALFLGILGFIVIVAVLMVSDLILGRVSGVMYATMPGSVMPPPPQKETKGGFVPPAVEPGKQSDVRVIRIGEREGEIPPPS